MLTAPSRIDATGTLRSYIRFAALGDSATFGVGDRPGSEYRGWARILASAMAVENDVSFCNLATPGARTADVRRDQLPIALAHGPHLVSLIVGVNDVLHVGWDRRAVHADLQHSAERLTERGAVLMTARFHDPTRILRLPRLIARPLRARIDELNSTYDEIHDRFGGVRVDLSTHPGVYDREFWSLDRLHPSELGHRALADEFAAHLAEQGLTFDPPDMNLDGTAPGPGAVLDVVIREILPWIGRRVWECTPVALDSLRALARR